MARNAVSGRQLIRDMGTCLSFNGTNARVVKSSFTGAVACNASQSISFWLNAANMAFNHTIFSYELTGSSQIGAIFSGARPSTITITKWGGGTLITSIAKLMTSRWYHIVYTFDGTTNSIYINGALDNTSTTAAQSGVPTTLVIGNFSGLSNPWYAGLMDDYRIYNRLLGSTEVSNMYYGTEPSSSNFLLQWKFDEGSGTSATDLVGSNTGAITNATYSSDVAFKLRVATSGRVVTSGRVTA